ncbi:MAG: hypothetical protein ACKVG4_10665 [Longimicrobiales bacterium]|jgi:hypothetical protein
MSPTKNIWYRIGYALEQARHGPPATTRSLRGFAERATERKAGKSPKSASPAAWPTADDLITTGLSTVVAKALDGWKPRRVSGLSRMLRAGAAGAAAALFVEIVGPLLKGERSVGAIDRGTGEKMLVGAGQGLVYGAVVEPRVPGPALMKGALYGSAEYAVDPMGGLSQLLRGHSPQGKLPIVGALLDDLDPHDRAYVEHVMFGIALAVLYGSSPSSNGIRIEVDDE